MSHSPVTSRDQELGHVRPPCLGRVGVFVGEREQAALQYGQPFPPFRRVVLVFVPVENQLQQFRDFLEFRCGLVRPHRSHTVPLLLKVVWS